MSVQKEARRGFWSAAAAFGYWGLLPIYWRALHEVSAFELILYRVVLTGLLLLGLLWWQGRLRTVVSNLRSIRQVCIYGSSGALLTLNWLIFIWATNHGRIVEASLGDFVVPLLNVALGALLLRERLTRVQWLAIGLAGVGVAVPMLRLSNPPWVALSLAVTFCLYGLIRKRASLGAVAGLTIEMLLLAPLAGTVLVWLLARGNSAWVHVSVGVHFMMLILGVVTAIPLVSFAYGVRRIRLSTIGLLQYITPVLHFLLGWSVYGEPLSRTRLLSFVLIWIGILIYAVDSLRTQWQEPRHTRRPESACLSQIGG